MRSGNLSGVGDRTVPTGPRGVRQNAASRSSSRASAKQPCSGRLSSARWIPLLVVPEHGIHAGKELTHDRDDRHLLLLPFGQQVLVVGGESWIVATGGKGRHEQEAAEPGPAALDPAFAAAVG